MLFRFAIFVGLGSVVATIIYLTPIPEQTFLSCDRPCHHLDWPMICRVKLNLEPFFTLSKSCGDCPINQTACLADHCITADGQHRGVLTANRQLPGPSIQVCENDILVVDVVNRVPGKAAAIHWRGQNQKETPCMDGVPLVTQCPIPSYTTFQYKFRASVPGTHLWHSHSGADIANGIFGSLIVRQADAREPHRALYDVDDPDHVLLVSQWHHSIVTETGVLANRNKKPALLLINGKGRQPNGPEVPLSTFTVSAGKRYRFRLAHAGGANACPITFTIEDHLLNLIALDGNPVNPERVGSITLSRGERVDFVLKADQSASVYRISVNTNKNCGSSSIFGSALLKYTRKGELNSKKYYQSFSGEKSSNEVDMTTSPVDKCGSPDNLCVGDIKALTSLPSPLDNPRVDVTIYLPINRRKHLTENSALSLDLETKVMSIKNATFTYPSSPLLTQGSDVPEEILCTEHDTKTSGRCRQLNGITSCECVNTRRIPLGSSVELILIDQAGRDDLVFHLHGYSFYVVGARAFDREKSFDEIKAMDEQGILFARNLISPVLKDTITVPKFGAVALRFKADNPGYWMLRDENALEWTRGLDVILQVGEPSDMVPPPQDFPKCGSFVGPDYFLI
ncbi:laccase-2-like isoform X2 [Chelonus insularis]|uniref:laccase-2-like isoform X2 n=1 Tax=Chelonus insularis TaxID=460826 RepID=UPI00158B5C10|nr:laccase-2-like isoform X2 [Chelonus insularis]